MPLQAAGRRSLVDSALDQLREQVTHGTWPVGTRIPSEHTIAEQLEVGRNTVREAVRVLVHAGMLETRQGDGTYVRSTTDPGALVRGVDRAATRDIFEVRRALDVEAARLAAHRRTADDVARIRAALGRRHDPADRPGMTDADLEAFVEHDAEFHTVVAEASHNDVLVQTYRWFSESLRRSIRATMHDPAVPESPYEDHAALAEAIEAGDVEGAAAAARRILEPAVTALDALTAYRKPV